jgi:hypothetical protein
VEVNKGGRVLLGREVMTAKPFRKVDGVDVPHKKVGQLTNRGGAVNPQAIYNMLLKHAQECGMLRGNVA